MYDTHVHSMFSHDGKSTMEEYIDALRGTGLKGIGFTEHLDFMPEAGGYGYFNYDSYSGALNKLREDGYDFYKGLELGYGAHVESATREGVKDMEFDYIIGAVHRIDGRSMSTKRFYEFIESGGDYLTMIEHYYEAVGRCLEIEFFDVIAHIGVFKKWLTDEARSSSRTQELIRSMEFDLAKKCAKSEKIVEVNTSSLFSAACETAPNYEFLSNYYNNRGRLVSVGSDAHTAGNLGWGLDLAAEMLKNIGFKYITLPWDIENPAAI